MTRAGTLSSIAAAALVYMAAVALAPAQAGMFGHRVLRWSRIAIGQP